MGVPELTRLSEDLYRYDDSCMVYIIRSGREAVLVDIGTGGVLDYLDDINVDRVTDVLMTHHHRDQAQGLPRAAVAGARIWVPHTEQELFHSVDVHWQAREIANNYNMRQDRFSLLEPVPVAGTLQDYTSYCFGDHQFTVLPTPGHTVGSISLLAELDGQRIAFTGDLIAAPGKLWSLAATQWSYNGAEGVAASVASLLDLQDRAPGQLLPSHGEPIDEPAPAISLLVERLWRLLQARGQNPRLRQLRAYPYEHLTPHLLRNRTSLANSYVLLSESGKALILDYGYDFVTGMAAGTDRASRRPWLYTLPALKAQYGVRQVDVVIPTHYHDDHVAGFNLLRSIEGTQVWAGENFADLLRKPDHYDLPCLWYDPIQVDRELPLEQPIPWEEYELTLHEQPGHTLYAVAVAFHVDGRKVLAVGDQYEVGDRWNYVYQNCFRLGDYQLSAALYQREQPDILLFGHRDPIWVTPCYLDSLAERGVLLDDLHRDLLLEDTVNPGAEGATSRIRPYHSRVPAGEWLALTVELQNPFPYSTEAVVSLAVPSDWCVEEPECRLSLVPFARSAAIFRVCPPAGRAERRARVAADVVVGGQPFGQAAEALVTVLY